MTSFFSRGLRTGDGGRILAPATIGTQGQARRLGPVVSGSSTEEFYTPILQADINAAVAAIDLSGLATTVYVDSQDTILANAISSLTTTVGGKEPTITAGTSAEYLRGDKTWQSLNQAAVAGLTTADSPTFAGITLGASGVLVGGTNVISQRNGANPQEYRINEQWTSDLNRSYLSSRARTGANFEFGPVVDGATQRGLTIGSRATTASAITPWLAFTNAGAASIPVSLTTPVINGASGALGYLRLPTDVWANRIWFDETGGKLHGVYIYHDNNLNGIRFEGVNAGNSVTLFTMQRNGGQANFHGQPVAAGSVTLSGVLQLGNEAAAATPTATHTITIRDSTGTTYRILAVI